MSRFNFIFVVLGLAALSFTIGASARADDGDRTERMKAMVKALDTEVVRLDGVISARAKEIDQTTDPKDLKEKEAEQAVDVSQRGELQDSERTIQNLLDKKITHVAGLKLQLESWREKSNELEVQSQIEGRAIDSLVQQGYVRKRDIREATSDIKHLLTIEKRFHLVSALLPATTEELEFSLMMAYFSPEIQLNQQRERYLAGIVPVDTETSDKGALDAPAAEQDKSGKSGAASTAASSSEQVPVIATHF